MVNGLGQRGFKTFNSQGLAAAHRHGLLNHYNLSTGDVRCVLMRYGGASLGYNAVKVG